MKVRVLQKHIDKGIPGRILSCPIALAIQEKRLTKSVSVGNIEVERQLTYGKKIYYLLPRGATIFIDRFDKGKFVRPTTFNFRPVPLSS